MELTSAISMNVQIKLQDQSGDEKLDKIITILTGWQWIGLSKIKKWKS